MTVHLGIRLEYVKGCNYRTVVTTSPMYGSCDSYYTYFFDMLCVSPGKAYNTSSRLSCRLREALTVHGDIYIVWYIIGRQTF